MVVDFGALVFGELRVKILLTFFNIGIQLFFILKTMRLVSWVQLVFFILDVIKSFHESEKLGSHYFWHRPCLSHLNFPLLLIFLLIELYQRFLVGLWVAGSCYFIFLWRELVDCCWWWEYLLFIIVVNFEIIFMRTSFSVMTLDWVGLVDTLSCLLTDCWLLCFP